jgi:hypothetical protein
MNFDNKIKDWIRGDSDRMEALYSASTLKLNDWCIAAGFVRNLVWDILHRKKEPTPLNDIDLIYFDPNDVSESAEKMFEGKLKSISNLPWSVKNQARMHVRNKDAPYFSTIDAMSYWVEVETAVGVTLPDSGDIEILAPFGVSNLFKNTVTFNDKRQNLEDFYRRVEKKQWLSHWPNLTVST